MMQRNSIGIVKLADGSNFELSLLSAGVVHVTTTGPNQIVRDFTPIILDAAIHFLSDGTTRLARAHVSYRYGNPDNRQVAEPLRTEVLSDVLTAVHQWHQVPYNFKQVGVLDLVEDAQEQIVEAQERVKTLKGNMQACQHDLNRALQLHPSFAAPRHQQVRVRRGRCTARLAQEAGYA